MKEVPVAGIFKRLAHARHVGARLELRFRPVLGRDDRLVLAVAVLAKCHQSPVHRAR
jgi:hypothetical protein